MRLQLWTLLVGLIVAVQKSSGVNILCLMGIASPSHHIWNRALMEAVAARGHNLTIVSCDTEKTAPPNMHYIHLENVYAHLYNGSDDPLNLIDMANGGPIDELYDYYKFGMVGCEGIYNSKGLSAILSYPKSFKFDLILHDFTFGPCMLAIAKHFDHYPPVVSVTAFSLPPFTPALVGGHKYPAYIPYYSLSYGVDMSFWQRCKNAFMYMADSAYRRYVVTPRMKDLMRKSMNMPNLDAVALEEDTALLLVNTHPSVDFPEPLPPNIIPVAGLQIKEPKALGKDLEQFLRAGKKGAVLVSLGTNVRSDMLDQPRLEMFLKAMEQLPDYNFVWKFESDGLPRLPKNVLIRPWLPQNDILGHANTRAFVTHAGLLSTLEATWHNVPMVGIPFIADQHRNLFKAVENGVAVKVSFQTMTTEKLRNALTQVLEDPSYRQRMAIVSHRLRDQPEKPIDRAVWWVEWVLRNPKPDHLVSPTMSLGWFRSNLYDVYVIFLGLGVALLYGGSVIVKRMLATRVSGKVKNE